jgi:hypothetical protein
MFDIEFNPKGWSLLDEQLAESGLEMNIVIGAGAIISGVTSVIGGIVGSNQADAANRKAEKAYEEQMEAAEDAANETNKYNKAAFKVDVANYQRNRQYEYDTALRNWRYQTEIQEYQYLSAIKQYGKSVDNTESRLAYNDLASKQAYEAEQSALNELYTEDAFSRQGMLVDQLQNEGRAALGQAGNSRGKALQSSIAALGRNAAIMDASLSSSVEQSQRNLRQIGLQRYAADVQARASMMIRPERPPAVLKPEQAPERIFIKPMKVLPGAVQAPTRQSVSAPLFSGLTSAATAIAGGIGGGSYNSNWSNIGSTGGGGGFGGPNLGISSSSGFNLNANYGGFS